MNRRLLAAALVAVLFAPAAARAEAFPDAAGGQTQAAAFECVTAGVAAPCGTPGSPVVTTTAAGAPATSANQATMLTNQGSQITQETALNTVIGTVSSTPTANTIADRLKQIQLQLAPINYAIGSTTSGQLGGLTFCTVVSGDQAYTAGQSDPGTCTPGGRWRVGLSSAASSTGAPAAAEDLLIAGVYNSTPITATNTQQYALQLDANGYLKINCVSGCSGGGSNASVGTTGGAAPGSATLIGYKDGSGNIQPMGSNDTGLGVTTAQTSRTTTAADSPDAVSLATIATNSASQATAANQTAVQSNAGSDGTKVVNVQTCSTCSIKTSAAQNTSYPEAGVTSTVVTVFAGAKTLDFVICSNSNTAGNFIQYWDTTGAVTVGTTANTGFIPIPGTGGSGSFGAGYAVPLKIKITAGLKIASTTTPNGSTAPGTADDCTLGAQ